MGTSASCQGSKGADIGETCSHKQTSGLKLQADIRAYTIQTSLARKILSWTMWLCLEDHTFTQLFEEL